MSGADAAASSDVPPAPMTDEEHAIVANPAGFNEAAVLAPPPPEHRRTRPLPGHLQPKSVDAVAALFGRCVPTGDLDPQLRSALHLPVPRGVS
mmetsp:Transcript_32316/g.100011  ORF Transcript_32316/g.100011 Transcript_32316/m.100011 type:complete len:93 (+) Transcript_32316:62-340(+)|eukprot:CAMPEP_0174826862 /NCGR_PEP_ID=MMETSP1114-20130205/280_1 /TAXON_ID=312471 /ORGANISM="Neobodo designis, Strain CCAP 1951/1" /LENGTH=92 /DNA_ID=CAMNT_0016060431 /DNA_START=62 /DNA_END=340 /DNA_ORIENTATION=+